MPASLFIVLQFCDFWINGNLGSFDNLGLWRKYLRRDCSNPLSGLLHDIIFSSLVLLWINVVGANSRSQPNSSKEFWFHVWIERKSTLHDFCRLSLLGITWREATNDQSYGLGCRCWIFGRRYPSLLPDSYSPWSLGSLPTTHSRTRTDGLHWRGPRNRECGMMAFYWLSQGAWAGYSDSRISISFSKHSPVACFAIVWSYASNLCLM